MARVGFFQFKPEFGRVDTNLRQVESALRGVRADLVMLPELAFTGYFFEDRAELERLAEDPADSSTVDRLLRLCRDEDCHLVTGFAERSAEKVFNSALLIGPDGVLRTYRKLHLFNTEKEYFDPGDSPLEVISVRGIKVGMMICFDWIFPEAARTLALKGADLICHPSNLVLSHCQQAMLIRSLENGVFSITTNRHGTEKRPRGELTFTGQSQIVDPSGRVLHRAPPSEDQLCVVEIDPSMARNKAITARNDRLGDRRPEYYGPLSMSAPSGDPNGAIR